MNRANDRSVCTSTTNPISVPSRALSGLLMIGLLAATVVVAPAASLAGSISVGISVGIAPPPIPVYTQPVCPAPGYIWTPGYWAYDPADGYFWVPGTWVPAPQPGFLWTPGYWGWGGSAFFWHVGYWGPHVGFYGGINYGFGYNGVGFVGGEWRGGHFFYNRAVNNFGGRHFDDVYDRPVRNNFAVNRVSYNGGRGGLQDRPTSGELAAEHDRHMGANSMQRQQESAAHNERGQFASENHGRPGIAATGRPGEFRSGAVSASRVGGPVNSAEYHGANSSYKGPYTGGHSPNPSGGGNHTMMTAHQNSPASHNSSPRGGGASTGQYHSPPAGQYQGSRAVASNHQPSSHQPQEHSAHGSAGSGAPHGGATTKHESQGGEARHR